MLSENEDRYDSDADVMDAGGIVQPEGGDGAGHIGAKPKKAKGGAGQGVKAKGGAGGGVVKGGTGSGLAETQATFILIGNDKSARTATEKAEIEKLIGELLVNPTEFQLFKAVRFVPEFNL